MTLLLVRVTVILDGLLAPEIVAEITGAGLSSLLGDRARVNTENPAAVAILGSKED